MGVQRRFYEKSERTGSLSSRASQFTVDRVLNRNKRGGKLSLWFCGKDRRIAGDVFDLLHRDDGHFLGGVHLQDFHVVADGMADGVIDEQFLIVGEDYFDPIDHDGSSVNDLCVEVETMAGSLLYWPDGGNRRIR